MVCSVVRDFTREGIILKLRLIMDVGQSMTRQYRHRWQLILVIFSSFSVADASNSINAPCLSTEFDCSSVELERSDNLTTIKLAGSDDHMQALERSLYEFDEKLLRELEKAQQERQQSARQKAAVRSDAELEAETENEEQGQEESEVNANGEAASEGKSNETADSTGQESGAEGELPGQAEANNSESQNESSGGEDEGSVTTQKVTIPDGNDDDVIARQLREAAKVETDPQVKEKLWAEYRKYKKQKNTSTAPSAP